MSNEKASVEAESGVLRRLDVIIRMLLEEQVQNGKLQRGDQVLILDSMGLSSSEIGGILGQRSKDVSSWLKRLRAKPPAKASTKP